MTKEQQKLLSESLLRMLRAMPYYGIFVIGIPRVENRNIETAQTNYFQIEYNPEWLLGGEGKRPNLRPRDEVIFVWAHEVLHMAFKHGLRMGFRNARLWNVACDFSINIILHDGQVGKMPEAEVNPKTGQPYPRLLDEKYRGMSAETIYDLLEKEHQKQGGKDKFNFNGVVIDLSQDDPGGMGGFTAPANVDGSNLTDAQRQELERDIDSKNSQAAAAAKSVGKLPLGLEVFLKTALKPVVDWKERLRMFVARHVPTDLTWQRPRKRFLWNDLYLPSTEKTGVGPILCIMDTSGSVDYSNSKSEGAQYWAEILGIFEDVNPERLHVMYVDAEVQRHDVYEQGEEPELRVKGRGGTDFRPPFHKVDKEAIDIQCAIYLTDMMGPFPEKAPDYPVLWVATTGIVAPFGETIRIMK